MWSHLKTAAVAGIVGALAATATVAVAGSGIGGVFNLGATNSVNQPSVLAGTTPGSQAVFYNASTAANAAGAAVYGKSATTPALQAGNLGAGPALGLTVAAGHAPLTVNSATKVANLNADRLDGLDATQLQAKLTVEAWHDVGTAGQPAFATGFVGGHQGVWQNPFESGDAPVAFFKDPFGVVHLKGLTCFHQDGESGCNPSILTDDAVLFQLPAGYRPSTYQHFPALTDDPNDHSSVLITPDGTVLIRTPGYTTGVALEGMTFRAGS
ncbi:MAG: hypothetical protein QOE36_451 [Gaiellaceae bacterium]|jgi:hypothetical protein|nr:hypothetical protein [Gaiellaceae bacterium]